MPYFVTIKEDGFDTVTHDINPGGTHMHLILASIFVWFKAEPEFPVLPFSPRRIDGQWTVWPFSTWGEEKLVDAAAKTNIEQQNTESQMMAAIEEAHSLSMKCQLIHKLADDWI